MRKNTGYLVDNSLQGLIIVTGAIPRFRFVNNRIAEMTGYSCEELENFSPEQIQNLIYGEDREEVFWNISCSTIWQDNAGT